MNPSFSECCYALVGGMHLLGQCVLQSLRHRLLRSLRHRTFARGMSGACIAGRVCPATCIVEAVGNFLLDFLGEHLLELLWHDGVANGVGSIGSLTGCRCQYSLRDIIREQRSHGVCFAIRDHCQNGEEFEVGR